MLSVALITYQSQELVRTTSLQIIKTLEQENIPFELLIVDDCSTDNTFHIACSLEKSDNRIRVFQLSKNYTSHNAIFAAISLCTGSCFTAIPDDLQLPLDTVIKMYRLWEKGQKIVIPFRKSRDDGRISEALSALYYSILNSISQVKFPKGGADGFLIDKEIICILNNQISHRNTSTIVEVLRLGFEPVFIPYDRPYRTRKSRWTIKKKLNLALDTILSSSIFPIKIIVFSGVFSLFISVLLVISALIIKIFKIGEFLGFPIPGWTTNFIMISFFSGLILFSLGIIAEYIWRIHEEMKGRPGFIIKQRKNSSE